MCISSCCSCSSSSSSSSRVIVLLLFLVVVVVVLVVVKAVEEVEERRDIEASLTGTCCTPLTIVTLPCQTTYACLQNALKSRVGGTPVWHNVHTAPTSPIGVCMHVIACVCWCVYAIDVLHSYIFIYKCDSAYMFLFHYTP